MDSTSYESVKENAISLLDYGFVLYRNQLSSMCKKFGAEIKHTRDGNRLLFKASTKVPEAYQQYGKKPVIKCFLINHSEGSEGSEGSGERTPQIYENEIKNANEPLSTSN